MGFVFGIVLVLLGGQFCGWSARRCTGEEPRGCALRMDASADSPNSSAYNAQRQLVYCAFSFLGCSFHVCVWDSIFRATCIFRRDPDYNSTCWGGHGRWEDGAAGDVGHTKMGLLGAPSGVHSRTGGILFGWSVLCVCADGLAAFQGFFCCEIFSTSGYILMRCFCILGRKQVVAGE